MPDKCQFARPGQGGHDVRMHQTQIDDFHWMADDIGRYARVVIPDWYVGPDGSGRAALYAHAGRTGRVVAVDGEGWSGKLQFPDGETLWVFRRECEFTQQAGLL